VGALATYRYESIPHRDAMKKGLAFFKCRDQSEASLHHTIFFSSITWEADRPPASQRYGAGAMENRRTFREQIECRDFEAIALPQRVCLGVAAFGAFALIVLLIYCAAFMK
jgi:hypothetical protein